MFFLIAVQEIKRKWSNSAFISAPVVTYQDGFDEIANDYYIGRAFDNRVGGFMIAEVARLLKQNNKKLPFGLYVVNAVQEEIGLRGAEMIARRIKPDIAIVTDVTHDTTTPMISKLVEGEIACGKGTIIGLCSCNS
jgi:putative aminopeptidase FrvX